MLPSIDFVKLVAKFGLRFDKFKIKFGYKIRACELN